MIKGVKLDGFSNYWIFPTLGMVWSIKSNRWIGHKGKNEYWYVGLTDDDGEQHKFQLYRLIWMTVNGEIPEGMQVNHKSEDKDDNSIANLNLLSPKANINWGTGIQRSAKKRSKQVGAYLNGALVMTFPSTAEANKQNYDMGAVSRCCRNCFNKEGNNVYKGYQWRYLN